MKTTRALETASGGQWRCTARLDEPLREPSQCTTPPRARARPGILHCLRFDVWHVLAITPVMCRHVARWVVINKNDPHGAMGKEVGHLDEVPKLSTNFYCLRTSHNMPCFAQVMLEQVSSKIINQRPETRVAWALRASVQPPVHLPVAGMALPRLALSPGHVYRSRCYPEERPFTRCVF